MAEHDVLLLPHDPVISRDGRPFSTAGVRMRSMDWIPPSVAAGVVRTVMGKAAGGDFTNLIGRLKDIAVKGPLPSLGGQLYFPAPADVVYRKKDSKCFALQPMKVGDGEGCDLPKGGLHPALMSEALDDDSKPDEMPAFWRVDRMNEWLLSPSKFKISGDGFWTGPEKDIRTHVRMNTEMGAAKKGLLFQATGLAFADGAGIAIRVVSEDALANGLGEIAAHPFGGERRVAFWKSQRVKGWEYEGNAELLQKADHLRMVLATPALLGGGWCPGWLKEDWTGSPPNAPELELKLVGAAVNRWKPISGYSYENVHNGKRQKPAKRMAPAGSVYFFDVVKRGKTRIADLWLRPVSDKPQDQLDGFGLALWGIWSGLQG